MSYTIRKIQERNISLDLIRFVAIACVLINHSVEFVYRTYDHDTAVSLSSFDKRSVIVLLFTIGRLGVPLFLMLTGYLMLHRDYDSKGSLRHFWIHNLLSLIITWQIWLFFYNLLLSFLSKTPFNFDSWIRQMLFVKDNDLPHSWYIPMIIGIYVFLPFIARGIKNLEAPVIVFIILISYAAFLVVPSVNVFFSASGIEYLSLKANPVFTGSAYCMYIIMGHLVYLTDKRRMEINKKNTGAAAAIIIAESVIAAGGLALSFYLQIYLHSLNSPYMIWYSFFTLPPTVFCIFALIRRIRRFILSGFIKRISICSFGMYLIHFPVLKIMLEKNTIFKTITTGWSDKYICLSLFIITFFISYGITEGLAHIPYAGELLVKVRSRRFRIF